jgi:hypothetical protein
VEGTAVLAGFDLLVGGRRLRARELLGQRDDAVELFAVALEPREVHAGEIGRRDSAALDQRCEHGDRLECQILEVAWRFDPRRPRDRLEVRHRPWRPLLRAAVERTERHRRLGVERHVELAQLFVTIEVAADAADRQLFLGVGEVEAVDLLGAFQRVLAELRRRAAAALCAHRCRHCDRRGHRRRHGLDEPSSSDILHELLLSRCVVTVRLKPDTTDVARSYADVTPSYVGSGLGRASRCVRSVRL